MDDAPPRLEVSGVFDDLTQTVLCRFLNDNWDIAGVRPKKLKGTSFGPVAVSALQTFLNARVYNTSERAYEIPVDGTISSATVKALRIFLNENWDKAGFRKGKLLLRGVIHNGFDTSNNRGTVKALQCFLNSTFGNTKLSDSDGDDAENAGRERSSSPALDTSATATSNATSHADSGGSTDAKPAGPRPPTQNRSKTTSPVAAGHAPLARTQETCGVSPENVGGSRRGSAASRRSSAASEGGGRKGSTASQGLQIFRSMGDQQANNESKVADTNSARSRSASVSRRAESPTLTSLVPGREKPDYTTITNCEGLMHKLPIHNLVNTGTGKDRIFKLRAGVLEYYTTRSEKLKGSLILTAACTLEEQWSEAGLVEAFKLLVPDQGVLVVRQSRRPMNSSTPMSLRIAPTGALTAPLNAKARFREEDDAETIIMFVAAIKNSIELLRRKPDMEVSDHGSHDVAPSRLNADLILCQKLVCVRGCFESYQ